MLNLTTNDSVLSDAFRIAVDTLEGNVRPWSGDVTQSAVDCIIAGGDYDKPWTRDATLNAFFAGNICTPDVAKNTLLSVLIRDESGLRIGGQYWDAIIWVTGAWHHFLCTHDTDFLQQAFEASVNAIRYFEQTEFDTADNLFRGGACFQDGVSGYPAEFADGPTSGILEWVDAHPESKTLPGHGLPIKALSTNCLYYNAYQLLPKMAAALDTSLDSSWSGKAAQLKLAINQHFWDPQRKLYRYLIDANDDDGRHEGFGHAFVILFGIADEKQAHAVLNNQHSTPQGIPCVWPSYPRYSNPQHTSFGRHSGVIWPQVNTAWVLAAIKYDRGDIAWSEMKSLASKAVRDDGFVETYHPITGEPYGGVQERFEGGGDLLEWGVRYRQTWCATGYIQMVLATLFGMQITQNSISFLPSLPDGIKELSVQGLIYNGMSISVDVKKGHKTRQILVNGTEQQRGLVLHDQSGTQGIEFKLP